MNYFKPIYQISFYFITLITFVFGGFIQFFFSISNTVITFFITLLLYAIYILYMLLKKKIVFNRVVLFSVIYLLLIIVSAIINKSDLVKTLVYFIFPLLPLGTFLYCYINNKEGFISQKKIFSLFYYIALIQFPILLLQMNFYDFFIQFNHSGQTVAWYDFMFGSFFIKSDHSLGVFLLLIIAIILLKKEQVKSIVLLPKIAIAYLGITIFFTESNISKLFLVVLISSYVLIPLYKKHGKSLKFKLGVVLLSFTMLFSGYLLKDKKFIQDRLGGVFERQISIEAAEKFYELGTAKRFQIIIVAVKKLDTKWIGDGPYSYFNILTGEFKKTQHFTQLIWTYFDLGILGLIIVLSLMWYLIRYLDIDKGLPTLFFFGVFFVYSFYVPIFSDIAIIFSLFFIFSRRHTNLEKAFKLN